MTADQNTEESPTQNIQLQELPLGDLILDIGGGGEGLVSRIGGKCVCAVDYRMNEIREAQIHDPPANWFVSDARCLPFRSNSFDMATLWFSLGYMRDWKMKEQVLSRVLECLRPSGKLSIMSCRIDSKSERFVFNAMFILPDGTISKVGYGVRGNQEQTVDSVCTLLKKIGFNILDVENHDWWFKILARKGVQHPIVPKP